MAHTVIGNLQKPAVWAEYVIEPLATKSAFRRSGVVATDSRMQAAFPRGGSTFNFPFFQRLSGADEVLEENTALTVNNVTASKQIATRLLRGKSFGSEYIASVLAGADPIELITTDIVNYWAEREQQTMLSIMKGVIADNDANDSDDLIEDDTGGNITAAGIIDAKMKLGDNANKITLIAMHSVPYGTLLKANLIDNEPLNTQNLGWGTYLGMSVVVDDTMTVDGSTYYTYLCAPMAFGYAEDYSDPNNPPIEEEREALKSQTSIITRRNYTLHPMGFAYTGTPAAETPTNAELDDATSWNRVYDKKNCGFSVLWTDG
jgi:hypothetical protein